MQRLRYITLTLCVLIAGSITAQAQKLTETKSYQAVFSGSDHALAVKNVTGDVKVEAYDGSTVQVTARKTIKANREEDRQKGAREVHLKVREEGSNIYICPVAPFIHADIENGNFSFRINRDDPDYHFRYDLDIKVPRDAQVRASTINDGEVHVAGVKTRIKANNVNGPITLEEVTGPTEAHTVNGDITVRYDQNPKEDCTFRTVNGEITAWLQPNFSADVRFKSLNGDLYTNFEDVTRLPARVQKTKDGSGPKTRYRIDRNASLRFGKGGPELSFRVLNGDVYLKNISSENQ